MKKRTFCLFLVIIILFSNVTYASEAHDLERYLSDADISEICAHNLAVTDVWLNPGDHVAIFDDSQNDTYIKNLSDQIVGSAKTDHEKLVAIYDWVIDNIYYDLDSYNFSVKGATIITDQDRKKFAAAGFIDVHGWYLVTGPVNTAVLHRGVCWDYSVLLHYLLGAQGIPAIIVHGYADGMDGWDEHAWNSVFIDGRWTYLDATWDSNNRYIQEEYYKGVPSYNYFDISLQDLSRNHYFSEYGKTEEDDIPSSWAGDEISAAITAHLVPYELQGSYRSEINRRDFCRLAIQVLDQVDPNIANNVPHTGEVFTDLEESDCYIIAANRLGIVNGTGNGKFEPTKNISREEAAVMLYRLASLLDIHLSEGTITFLDADSIASWASNSVKYICSSELMYGDGNKFHPKGTYTVEQAIVTFKRLFDKL